MTAISAVSRQVRTMADGTLRLTVDIEPASANVAFQLFGAPDVPMALARLTQQSSQVALQQETIERDKGGALAKLAGMAGGAEKKEAEKKAARLAGMWCADPRFWEWLNSDGERHIGSETEAAEYVRTICGVQSRADIDHNPQAEKIFHNQIRLPFGDFLRGAE